jgi:hypothetical protein
MSHRQVIRGLLLALAFAGGQATASATAARAQTSAAPSAELAVERAALQRQLVKVNTEIDALKRAGGVRDDYRLRARLADAEALARRLIAIDAKLGIRADGGRGPGPAPIAAPTDSAADLDAKADILVDQARRFRTQADALATRAQALKGRQELRRRAADLDRDPFAPMEGSKRRMASGSTTTSSFGGQRSDSKDIIGQPGPAVASTPTPPASTGSPAPVLSSLSLQFRDLLDTATLADIRRLEGAGTATAAQQALERASVALRARADELDARARGMRSKRP